MAAIDYLRLTTRDFKTHLDWKGTLLALFPGPVKDARVMQYSGWKGTKEPYFVGTADINSRRHYMMQVSGSAAELYMKQWEHNHDLPDEKSHCTRLDLQRTIPGDYTPMMLRSIWRQIPDDIYHSRIVGSDGLWTVYIGKRTQDRMCRIYTKKLDGERWLRVEYELKGNVAQIAFDALISRQATRDDLFEGMMTWNPAKRVLGDFMGQSGQAWTITASKKRPSVQGTIDWIHNIGPSLERHLNDHDLRPHVETMIRYLYSKIDTEGGSD